MNATALPVEPARHSIPLWRTSPHPFVTLGPTGTFAEEAARQECHPHAAVELVPQIELIYEAVEQQRVPYGLVPIENSIEGVVTASLDRLKHSSCRVVGERCLLVEHNLISHAPSLNQITTVYGHPQALAQCRRWLAKNLPSVKQQVVSSNAAGVVCASTDPLAAAIASERAAHHYLVPIVRTKIHDRGDNSTRFYVITQVPHDRRHDTVSILAASVPHQAGGLVAILKPFADEGINILSLHARPNQKNPWEYDFVLVVGCGIMGANLHRALRAGLKTGARMRYLGGFSGPC